MLYKSPGPHKIHGVMVSYETFKDEDVKTAMDDGWAASPSEAASLEKPKRGRKPKAESE